jgi:hypothetical protein
MMYSIKILLFDLLCTICVCVCVYVCVCMCVCCTSSAGNVMPYIVRMSVHNNGVLCTKVYMVAYFIYATAGNKVYFIT